MHQNNMPEKRKPESEFKTNAQKVYKDFQDFYLKNCLCG